MSVNEPPSHGQPPSRNIVVRLPGNNGEARNCKTIVESWNLLFPPEVLDKIICHTNSEIRRRTAQYKNKQSYSGETTVIELKALFGLLYLAGVLKQNMVNVGNLGNEMFDCPLFRATMSQTRFEFLLLCLRFDDKSTRMERKSEDKFAAIREVWELFISYCRKYYTPSTYCTVEEQLLGFRGRCPFRVCIQNKPDKCGIKITTLCDAKTFYMVNAAPYVGQVRKNTDVSVLTFYVRSLTEPIHGTNGNITCNSWFTWIPLVDTMMNLKLTVVGTLRKNKREIPPSFITTRGKQVPSWLHAFDGPKTLVSYIPRKNKSVVLLSIVHKNSSVDKNSNIPELVTFYNATKGGVDTLNQLCHTYTTARKSRRWPLRVFFGMLDQGAVNAMILFLNANPTWKDISSNNRRKFLKELALGLLRQHMLERLTVPQLPRRLVDLLRSICDETSQKKTRTSEQWSEEQYVSQFQKKMQLLPKTKG